MPARMRVPLVMIVIVAATTPARADHWYDDHRRVAHVAITATVGLAYIASETVLKSHLASTNCRWCNPDGLDVDVRNALLWNDTVRATNLSNLSGYLVTPGFALALTIGATVSSTRRSPPKCWCRARSSPSRGNARVFISGSRRLRSSKTTCRSFRRTAHRRSRLRPARR
jgi:hypothetical protein